MITINKLIANSIVITTGPVDDGKTRVKYTSGIQDWEGDIVGELTSSSIPNRTSIAEVEIGSHVTSIGTSAFDDCSQLTSVIISNGVTSINADAFYGSSRLTSVAIPDGVTSIGSYAFGACNGLTSVTIGNNVTSIDNNAFYNCTSVNDIYCYPNPANLTWNEDGKDDFKKDGSTVCHVKSEYLAAYQTKFGDEVNVTFVGDLT